MIKTIPAALLMRNDIIQSSGLRIHKVTKVGSNVAIETRRGIKLIKNNHDVTIERILETD